MAENRVQTRALRHPKPKYESDLFPLFTRIGNHLSKQEVHALVTAAGRKIDDNLKCRIKNGYDLLNAFLKSGSCDDSDLENIIELLRFIKRYDLLHLLAIRGKTIVNSSEDYLVNQIPQNSDLVSQASQTLRIEEPSGFCTSSASGHHENVQFTSANSEPPNKRSRRHSPHQLKPVLANGDSSTAVLHASNVKPKYTCDVRLRVRAEYFDYDSILQATVLSNKQDPLERQADCFTQANAILRTRDLGYIVCDIKFSEITYLDAFWRDYLNGSLLEALKGVFITETLRHAVGNESIKLLVHVDEDNYEKGRTLLLKNCQRMH